MISREEIESFKNKRVFWSRNELIFCDRNWGYYQVAQKTSCFSIDPAPKIEVIIRPENEQIFIIFMSK